MKRKTLKTIAALALTAALFLLAACTAGGNTGAEPPQTPEAEPQAEEPALALSEFCGETEVPGVKRLLTEGAGYIERFIKAGNYLVCLETAEGTLYIRSYGLADGKRQLDFAVPGESYGYLAGLKDGGFVFDGLNGLSLRFRSPSDPDPVEGAEVGENDRVDLSGSGTAPDPEIVFYTRSEYVTDRSDGMIITELDRNGLPPVYTVYMADGTAVYRGELAGDGMIGNILFLEDGFLYLWSSYDEDQESPSEIYCLDAGSTEIPAPVSIDEDIAAAIEVLEAEFPVTILYGEDVTAHGYGFTADVTYDKDLLTGALGVLADFLRDFPDGFLQEMYSGDGLMHPNHLTILLAGKLHPAVSNTTSNPAAYAFKSGSDQMITVDVTHDISLRITLAHETMHTIDVYLNSLTGWDPYPDWSNYLPEGFQYNESYVGADGRDYFDTKYTLVSGGPVWFVDVYSKTFAIEDRAVMFQSMFAGTADAFWVTNRHITNRMSYMASVIRSHFRCLDGAGPAIWERLLP